MSKRKHPMENRLRLNKIMLLRTERAKARAHSVGDMTAVAALAGHCVEIERRICECQDAVCAFHANEEQEEVEDLPPKAKDLISRGTV